MSASQYRSSKSEVSLDSSESSEGEELSEDSNPTKSEGEQGRGPDWEDGGRNVDLEP